MDISFCTLEDVDQQHGCVVVIDVLRAFTTSAVVLAAGADPYHLVATLDQAYALRRADPAIRLLGEVDGITAEGFDYGNSPTAISGVDFTGVEVAHRSSAGTQGVARATSANRVLTTSFAVARATAAAIAGESRVSFCVTGAHSGRDGEEDRACGDYIAALLKQDGPVDPSPYLGRVTRSTAAALFLADDNPDLPVADLPFAQIIDRYDFAMQARASSGHHLLTAIRGIPSRSQESP
ncbi:MAG: 2-phosphosulfolactate phosphatase [Euzebya sp.]